MLGLTFGQLLLYLVMLIAAYFVLGMLVRLFFGIKAQSIYNNVVLFPFALLIVAIGLVPHLIGDLVLYLNREMRFQEYFELDPEPRDEEKQKLVYTKIEELRLKWVQDQVNAYIAQVVPNLKNKDRSFFTGIALDAEFRLRFSCYLALACDYKITSGSEGDVKLSVIVRTLKRVFAA